jgi:hypothetical protein
MEPRSGAGDVNRRRRRAFKETRADRGRYRMNATLLVWPAHSGEQGTEPRSSQAHMHTRANTRMYIHSHIHTNRPVSCNYTYPASQSRQTYAVLLYGAEILDGHVVPATLFFLRSNGTLDSCVGEKKKASLKELAAGTISLSYSSVDLASQRDPGPRFLGLASCLNKGM